MMACRDGLCGGCRNCLALQGMWEDDRSDRDDGREEFTENARHALVAAANDLVKRGNVNDKELRALEELLEVFDPQEEEQQEEGRF